jgi:hypothetical protein
MDASDNLFVKIGATLIFVVPIASVVLYLGLKPRFWTPALIVLVGSILALAAGEYVHSNSVMFAVRNGVVFGSLFFFVSVVIGVLVRRFFWRQYGEKEQREMQGPTWRRRSRVLSAIAMVFGVLVLVLGWGLLENFKLKSAILAAVCFYLAYRYWRSPGGAGSVSEWLLEGQIGRPEIELSNNTVEGTRAKAARAAHRER